MAPSKTLQVRNDFQELTHPCAKQTKAKIIFTKRPREANYQGRFFHQYIPDGLCKKVAQPWIQDTRRLMLVATPPRPILRQKMNRSLYRNRYLPKFMNRLAPQVNKTPFGSSLQAMESPRPTASGNESKNITVPNAANETDQNAGLLPSFHSYQQTHRCAKCAKRDRPKAGLFRSVRSYRQLLN